MESQSSEPFKPRAISVREETYQIVTEEARKRGISRSLLMRLAIEAFLARHPVKETRDV